MSIRFSKRVPQLPSHFPPRWQLKVVYIYTPGTKKSSLEPTFGRSGTFWQIWQIWHFLADLARSTDLARIVSGALSGTFWPDPQVWPESARKCSRQRFWPESCPEHFLARIAGIATFPEKSRFLRFCRFLVPTRFWTIWFQGLYGELRSELVCTLLSETASDIMCTHA